MKPENNLSLNELEGLGDDASGDGGKGGGGGGGGRELEAVYDVPVQVSAVLGKATMQVSQLLKLGRALCKGLRGRQRYR